MAIYKCEFMLIGTHQALDNMPKSNVYITNELQRQVSLAKCLGIYILLSKMG